MPNLITRTRHILKSTIAASAVGCGLLALPLAASAHTMWLVPESGQGSQWHVLFGGHAGVLEPYKASKLKTIRAYNAQGQDLQIIRRTAPDGVHLSITGQPTVILGHFNNGIHTSRSTGPSVEKPMYEVPNATKATRTFKFHKTIAAWNPRATRAYGQPFEVVPLSAQQPRAGQPMQVRVLINGQPAPGIAIARNEEGRDAITNAHGIATFIPTQGYNKLWAGRRLQVQGNRAFTEDSTEYSLGFFAR